MNFSDIQSLDNQYIAQTYGRYPVAFSGGKGATLVSVDGKKYIDFGSGIAVNVFGANDREWKKAVIAQLNCIQHVSNYYYSEPTGRLAALLCEKTGAKRVFFGNSGAEANECALKAARKYSHDKYGEGRSKIISLKGSFHGRTLFTLSATGQEVFHQHFGPFVADMVWSNSVIDNFIEVAGNDACAVIIECIQGESGVNPLEKSFVQDLEKFCKEHDILLICDEVQSGTGRTGKMFAYEHYGIAPDIVTTAKGLGGGLPIGACLFFGKTENVLAAGDHGSTFGGNPVSCAGALNVVGRLTDDFLHEVEKKGVLFKKRLKKMKGVRRVTGMGLMIGIETDRPAKEIAAKCLENGLLVLTAHDKVRLLPPLNIKKSEINEGLKILEGVLQ